ncbi:phage antirepressor [Paenibacillus sp. FSL L8-0494]|uniref:phage antirepressor n=1 Tax=Paenibacillus sp. FSL L8-0494 TaxID=2975352 RepID=UPI0030F50657
MNELMMFEGNEVIVLLPGEVNFEFKGEFLIRAKDVANVLGYQGTSATQEVLKFVKTDHVILVKNSDMAIHHIRKLNNAGETFITNLGLNRVLGKSEMPKAEPFQDWLFEDVLPSISKHGAYMTSATIEKITTNPDFLIQLGNVLKAEQEKNKVLELKIEQDKPKVHYAEAIEISEDVILIGQLAKILRQKGIEMGEIRLFKWMRDEGYLCKSGSDYNKPTQRAMELGLFEIKTGYRSGSNGTTKLTFTTKVTGKGQIYFINKFLKAA